MNKKVLVPFISLVVIIIAVLIVLSLSERGQEGVNQQAGNEPAAFVCAQVLEEQKAVTISLVKDAEYKEKGKARYRAEVETLYPVNVVGLALKVDPRGLKFESGDYANSAFYIQAPTDSEEGLVKLNRGMTGTGLLGKGEFGLLTFAVLGKKEAEPEIDLERTEVFFNNGCAEKARVIISNI